MSPPFSLSLRQRGEGRGEGLYAAHSPLTRPSADLSPLAQGEAKDDR